MQLFVEIYYYQKAKITSTVLVDRYKTFSSFINAIYNSIIIKVSTVSRLDNKYNDISGQLDKKPNTKVCQHICDRKDMNSVTPSFAEWLITSCNLIVYSEIL
jgi:hypothetical protein